MLALEVARLTNPLAVILIASCRHPRAISPAALRFASVGLRIPLPSAAARLAPLAIPALGPMGDAEREVILEMATSVPITFVRWGGRAILEWQGCEGLRCPVHHIHGRRDRIILWKRCRPDVVVPGAGHIVNLTHAETVNAAIRAYLASL